MAFQFMRPLRGATDNQWEIWPSIWISMYAPRVGRNYWMGFLGTAPPTFQCMRPYRALCNLEYRPADIYGISIHMPHAGHNHGRHHQTTQFCYFNLCTPYGAQPRQMGIPNVMEVFQYMCPMRDKPHFRRYDMDGRISIHAPLMGRYNIWKWRW